MSSKKTVGSNQKNMGRNQKKTDSQFLQKNPEYYGKFIDCEKNAKMWHSCGQYKMATAERKKAVCLSAGNISGYESFAPNHENFLITKKFKYLLPENRKRPTTTVVDDWVNVNKNTIWNKQRVV